MLAHQLTELHIGLGIVRLSTDQQFVKPGGLGLIAGLFVSAGQVVGGVHVISVHGPGLLEIGKGLGQISHLIINNSLIGQQQGLLREFGDDLVNALEGLLVLRCIQINK